jgi:hypothetical protein
MVYEALSYSRHYTHLQRTNISVTYLCVCVCVCVSEREKAREAQKQWTGAYGRFRALRAFLLATL